MITLVQTVRPTVFLAKSTSASLTITPVGDGTTAACIDDVTADEDATYIRHTTGVSSEIGSYEVFSVGSPPVQIGTIAKIRIGVRHRITQTNTSIVTGVVPVMRAANLAVYAMSTTIEDNNSPGLSYADSIGERTTNPVTGAQLTWTDLTAATFGIGFKFNIFPNYPDIWRVTQVYMEITSEIEAALTVDGVVVKSLESEGVLAKIVSASGTVVKTLET